RPTIEHKFSAGGWRAPRESECVLTQPSFLLPETLSVPEAARIQIGHDYYRFREALPPDLRGHCLDTYGIDIAGTYAGATIPNPFGKASGQLSLNARQVRRDAEAGLGFVVLKTVIAQNAAGEQKMAAWAF